MSALSTPGGGGTTAQSKPTSGKQKYQKLDINSLYCANRNENTEPSSVKSQLSRKHGMQILGKVPSARRPPANLPSLKTESGQETITSSAVSSSSTTTTTTTTTCTPQTTVPVVVGTNVAAGGAPGGWVSLPPPSSAHFRTEFPTLEAASHASYRTDHPQQPSLRPQTEGSWTSGGSAGVRPESASQSANQAPTGNAQQTPALRAILPSFLKGSGSTGLGTGSVASLRENRPPSNRHNNPRAAPRSVEALTARPILRDEQISSLDEMSHDAGWAQHDDIDYDQKLDFSDGESSAPKSVGRNSKVTQRGGADNDKQETKAHDIGDEEQIWAERRQKQNNEVAAAVARARQRKEEEQRRQTRDTAPPQHKEQDIRVKDKASRDRSHSRDRERQKSDKKDDRDREWTDDKDNEIKEQYDNKDKIDRSRDNDKERSDNRDRFNRDREREKGDRDYRDRDYGRNREQAGNAYSQNYNNIPPRFLKKQQNRQEEENKGNWAYTNKPPMRRQEPNQSYNAPRHNGRRSFSRDYSDREDEYRREKDNSGPQWRHEMQDYEKGREVDRQNSKESFRDYNNDYKDRKSSENTIEMPSRTSAAEKLSEVFERKSVTSKDTLPPSETQTLASGDRRPTPPASQRESSERDYGKISWAEDDQITATKSVENIDKKEVKKPEVEPQLPVCQPANFSQAVKMTSSLTHSSENNITNQAELTTVKSVQSQSKIESTEPVVANSSSIKPTAEQLPQVNKQKSDKDLSESESVASKSSIDPGNKFLSTTPSVESLQQKRSSFDEKKPDINTDHSIKNKEPVERKSSGSGSEKRSRVYGGGSGGFVYSSRGWGQKESRGRRSHLSSRSKNRASESDGSTDGPINNEKKDRRRAPRSPRAHKKVEKLEEEVKGTDGEKTVTENKTDEAETREPFAPRGQPSRRGRGGFQGVSRPPAPVKRVAGYGPPNTKSPFSQASRAKDDLKEGLHVDDKNKPVNKHRTGSSGRGRERRNKGGCPSGEDENWETTSEHSESGGNGVRRRSFGNRQQKTQGNRNQTPRQNNRGKREGPDFKANEVTDAMANLKLKKEELVDDGFQEVRNKKISKDVKGPVKDETSVPSSKPARNTMTQGGRNTSSSRNVNDKQNNRGGLSSMNKGPPQYERSRVSNLPPRFAKQLQKQQTAMGGDMNVAPPPPLVNAWEKPISQSLRGNNEDSSPNSEVDNKTNQAVQRLPIEVVNEPKNAIVVPCNFTTSIDKTGVLDGSTPPVETIIFENTNYKSTPPAEALKPKYQQCANAVKSQGEDIPIEIDGRNITFNGDVRASSRTIQELIAENGRPTSDGDNALGIQMSFEDVQKTEDSSDMKLDFAFDSDLGHLTDDKNGKSLGIARATHISTSNTISPLAADLNFKIASVKKVWEMPAVVENTEEMQFTGFEEGNTEPGSAPNVCKVKPTQQLQSPPPQHYNHVGYQGYGGLSVPSPPAVIYNSSQQLLSNSQQLAQQSGLYGAFLDQNRQQFGGFPGAPYAAGSAAPYNYQPPPDMFQSLPSQYHRMAAAAAGGGAAFGQSAQLANNPSTVLISNTSNSLMSASGKPATQQIGAIGSKAGAVGGVNSYGQQYLGYSGPVGDAYSLTGLLPRPAPPTNSYYSPYQATPAAPTYPLQFTQPAQSPAPFQSQYLSSQLQVAAAVQQMQQQQQFRAPLQQQYAPRPHQQQAQQLKSPLHENGFTQMCEAASPTPKAKLNQGTHSPTHHKYSHPPPTHVAQPIAHHQMVGLNNNGRGNNGGGNGNGGNMSRVTQPPRYPSPIQRPLAPAPQMYRPTHRHHAPNNAPPPHHRNVHMQHNNHYHYQQQRGGNSGVPNNGSNAANQERVSEVTCDVPATGNEEPEAIAATEVVVQDAKAE